MYYITYYIHRSGTGSDYRTCNTPDNFNLKLTGALFSFNIFNKGGGKMSIKEAKKYISELRKKQDNPYLWPDFLTGLPDKTAIIQKISEVYNQLGKQCISFMRIANIQPYLIKYGPDRHADIIQWAAAILKITSDKYKGFVGTCCTHDFVAICDSKNATNFVNEASKLFEKKALTFYNKEDLKKGTVLSFMREGKKVEVGFMKLIACSISEKTDIPKEQIIPYLGKLCIECERNQ